MRFTTTLILVVVLASVAALIFFSGGENEPELVGPTALFPGVNFNAVDRIELTLFLGLEAVLERQSTGRWAVVKPFRDDARAEEVERILIALEEAIREKVISSESAVDFASKGLDPVQNTIVFRDPSGMHRLDIGTRDPLGSEVFVLVDGEKVLYRTGANILNFMQLNPESLRDNRLFRIDPNVVEEVSMEGPEGTILAAERRRGVWAITAPIKDEANGGSVQNLVSRLGRFEARSVFEAAPSPEVLDACGFNRATWTITLRSGNLKRAVVFSPSELGPAGALYCRRAGEEAILLTVRSPYNDLPRDLAHYRLRQLLPQVRELVESVTVEPAQGPRMVLKRDKGQYFRIAEPYTSMADNVSDGDMTPVARFFSSLFSLEAEGFVVDGSEELPEDLAGYGLDEPRFRVIVRWEQGVMTRSLTLSFGRGTEDLINAIRSDKPRIIYSVERSSLDFLGAAPILLRDRRPFFQEIADVIRAEFTCDGKTFAMEREGKRKGGFFKPDPDQRFQVFMNELMREFAIRYVPGESAADDARFEEPWGRVRYSVEEKGKEPREIVAEFGARETDGFVGRSNDVPGGVFILKRGFRERFAALFEGL